MYVLLTTIGHHQIYSCDDCLTFAPLPSLSCHPHPPPLSSSPHMPISTSLYSFLSSSLHLPHHSLSTSPSHISIPSFPPYSEHIPPLPSTPCPLTPDFSSLSPGKSNVLTQITCIPWFATLEVLSHIAR